MLLLLAVLLVGVVLYYYVWKPQIYWKEKGIPFIRPLPIVGNFLWSSLQRQSFAEDSLTQYKQYPNSKLLGTFIFNMPSLMIKDPEIIKAVGIKDFDHFLDHTEVFFREDVDPLFGKNLFALKGQKWKSMRSTLSPSFTGSKMRGMFDFMSECGEQFTKHYLGKYNTQGDGKPIEVELKDLYTRFTNDIIASSAFGIKTDSFKDPHNIFFEMGRETSNFKMWKILMVNLFPGLMKLTGISLLPANIGKFFTGLVKDTLETREREHIIRPDMIHLLMEARKGRLHHEDTATREKDTGFAVVQESFMDKPTEKIELTDEDITAQAFIFFIAGFETASVTMCFASYELTVNPDLQRRLQQEIDDTLAECGGKITYAALNKMQFLDCVITETLRKWPPAVSTDRRCNKEYTIKADDMEMTLQPGEVVNFPIYGIHRDPQYYPNPDKFDPDRFSEENKDNLTPFTYLPFGIGPRNCIGSRFALMEAKLALFFMLAHFNITPSPKTRIPLVLKRNSSNMTAQHGFWFGLQPRKQRS